VLTALALCGALFAGLRHLHRNGGILRLLSGVPALGERVRIYELARLYLTLGMLLEGGIPVVRAIADVAGVVTPATHARLTAACAEIQAGMPLSMAFKQQELTTPIALRMLRVGERSGTLGRMLTQSAQFHGGEIGRWIESFTRTFEPLLMAAIGLVVGTIVVLLYLPIFDLAGGLS
jgi:general secretion pathway protein F